MKDEQDIKERIKQLELKAEKADLRLREIEKIPGGAETVAYMNNQLVKQSIDAMIDELKWVLK